MTYTVEQLEEQQVRAAVCASAEVPGDMLRELIRLAIIGLRISQ